MDHDGIDIDFSLRSFEDKFITQTSRNSSQPLASGGSVPVAAAATLIHVMIYSAGSKGLLSRTFSEMRVRL